MRKLVLGLVAAAAIAAPVAMAVPANAATTCQDVPTTTGPATFHATQPSGGGGNWVHTFSVNVNSDGGFTGTNVITGLDAGQTVTVNETVSGQITDKNSDGIKEVTVAAIRDSGFYTFAWSVTDAPMNGTIDSMTDGTTLRDGPGLDRRPAADHVHRPGVRHPDHAGLHDGPGGRQGQPRRVRLRCRARWHQGQGSG